MIMIGQIDLGIWSLRTDWKFKLAILCLQILRLVDILTTVERSSIALCYFCLLISEISAGLVYELASLKLSRSFTTLRTFTHTTTQIFHLSLNR
jgi:hypothetical protein